MLLTVGLFCLIAAIAGGGLKMFRLEIPVVNSVPRQIMLGLLGCALCAGSFYPGKRPAATPKKAVTNYVNGFVRDAQLGAQLSGVLVECGQSRAVTDSSGGFAIPLSDAESHAKVVTVKAGKPGYTSAEVMVAPGTSIIISLQHAN